MENIKEEYFEWMYQLVSGDRFRKLFTLLNSVDFYGTVPYDDNRALDGRCLRYQFGRDVGYEDDLIDESITGECSVLEMMIALSIRMEVHIMHDDDFGDRTAMWFWMMIKSLGLFEQNDKDFEEEYSYHTISRFLNRDYEPNGKGGLFTLDKIQNGADLRDVEIWSQMNMFCISLM